MKTISAWAVILSLMLSGTAQAQETTEQTTEETICLVPVSQWNRMNVTEQTDACRAASPQPTYTRVQTGDWLSPKLTLVGLFTTIIGVSAVLHFGEDDVHVLGDTYCVSDYGDVDYGNCGSPLQTKIGLGLIGSGVLMAFIGSRSRTTVVLIPQVSKTSAGASATIRWRGAYGRR